MQIADIIKNVGKFENCAVGAKIPWHDEAFSERMLENHLSQEHDWASRTMDVIIQQAAWIDRQFGGKPARILDLGCGPGLYTHLLAQQGHSCVGVDFAPASIAYARERALEAPDLSLVYVLDDVLTYEPDGLFDMVLVLFGEFNVFSAEDVLNRILRKAQACLKPGGILLVEMQTYEYISELGQSPATWEANEDGVFSENPHLVLIENSWDEENRVGRVRYSVIDAATGAVTEYFSCSQAYTENDLMALLQLAGFKEAIKVSREAWPKGENFDDVLQLYAAYK